MIAELFWSKEMRELVNKYRAEGTLNERAVKIANGSVYAMIFMGGLVLLFIFSNAFFAISTFISILLVCKLQMKFIVFNRVNRPYESNDLLEANVLTVDQYAALEGKTKVTCQIVSSCEVVVIGALYGKVWNKEDFPKVDDRIKIWVDIKSKKAMPDIDYIKQKYCLNKALLDSADAEG